MFSGVALGAGAFLLGTLTIYNITSTTLKRTQVKISKENEQLLFPNYVCNENEEGRASSFANLFYDHHCKKGTILTNSYDTERFL